MTDFDDLTEGESEMRLILSNPQKLHRFAKAVRAEWAATERGQAAIAKWEADKRQEWPGRKR